MTHLKIFAGRPPGTIDQELFYLCEARTRARNRWDLTQEKVQRSNKHTHTHTYTRDENKGTQNARL